MRLILAKLPFILMTVACARPEPLPGEYCGDIVFSHADPDTDFSAITTFAILPESGYPVELPDDLPADVRYSLEAANAAVRRELLALGLTEVDSDIEDPDVWVFSLAATEIEAGVAWQCVPDYVWWGSWGWGWDPCAWLTAVPVTYEVGTVIVGIADAEDTRAVFGGVIEGVLDCENPRRRLELGIDRIFDHYPAEPADEPD